MRGAAAARQTRAAVDHMTLLLGVLPSVLRTVALPLLAAVMGEGPPVHCL